MDECGANGWGLLAPRKAGSPAALVWMGGVRTCGALSLELIGPCGPGVVWLGVVRTDGGFQLLASSG